MRKPCVEITGLTMKLLHALSERVMVAMLKALRCQSPTAQSELNAVRKQGSSASVSIPTYQPKAVSVSPLLMRLGNPVMFE